MRFRHLAVAASASGAAVLLLGSREVLAFVLNGEILDLGQRDVRLFNNFADPTANDNTTFDPNFPGYTGAALACWKGVVEWGSELHGDGSGDPHQPGDLGSGGANFDPSWQGLATSAGSSDDNVISVLPTLAPGVLAWTILTPTAGWQIQFNEEFTWDDGPGATLSPGHYDIQGLVALQYGHALGLAASSVAASTMFSFIAGAGVSIRSLHPDDQAGIQAIYGVKSASKPRITGASVSSGIATITGTNFSATNNQVWFTRAGQSSDGVPIQVTGLTSDGTTIAFALPSDAGSGDVLVRNNGVAFANLSNAWPIVVPRPQITSASPASLPVLAPDGQQVLLGGSQLGAVTQVKVGGAVLAPSEYSIVSDGAIQLDWPLVGALGSTLVEVQSPDGTGSIAVDVLPCAPPVIDAHASVPGVVSAAAGLEVDLAYLPGHVVLLFASTFPTPTTLPGLADISIGAGATHLLQLKVAVIPASGHAHYSSGPLPAPVGLHVYLVGLGFPSGDPAWLVSDSDPYQDVVFGP